MPAESAQVDAATSPRRATRLSRSDAGPHRSGEASEVFSVPNSRHHPYPAPSARWESKGKSHKRRASKTALADPEKDVENDERDGEYELDDLDNVDDGDPIGRAPPERRHKEDNNHNPHPPSPTQDELPSPPHPKEDGAGQAPPSPPSAPPRVRQPPGSLNQLADGPDGHLARPPYPYSTLIRYAIEGSKNGRLTLSELYAAIENRFPWFLSCGNGWKNSVRHNLSLNKSFGKIARPITEPGKGAYWCINHDGVDMSPSTGESSADPPSGTASCSHAQAQLEQNLPPAGKRRGRKKRDSNAAETGLSGAAHAPPAAGPSDRDRREPLERYESYETPGPTEHRVTVDGADIRSREPSGGSAPQPTASHENDRASGPGPYDGPYPYQDSIGAPLQPSAAPPHYQPTPSSSSLYHPYTLPSQSYVPPLIDDRPDRTAPRTIYNHTASSLNYPPVSAGPGPNASYYASTHGPLGAFTNSPSYPHISMPLYYSRFAEPSPLEPTAPPSSSSSLAAAMTMPDPGPAAGPDSHTLMYGGRSVGGPQHMQAEGAS